MDSLNNIREVFSYNLRKIRGKRTQAKFAEQLGIPLRTYQNLESGVIPQDAHLAALAEKLGIAETQLFLDPDLVAPSPEVVAEVFKAAMNDQNVFEAIIIALSTLPRKK